MTCIAACKVGSRVVIGCDSQITSGGNKTRGVNKIIEFPYFTVGIAGGLTILHVLQELQKDTKLTKKIPMTCEEDARNFAKMIFSLLRDDYEFNNNEQYLNDSLMLVCTPSTIYEVSPYMSVMTYTDCASIGSGSIVAGAVMRVLRDQYHEQDASKIVSLAIDNAAHSDLYCSLPSFIYEVKNDKPVPTPRKRSKSPRGKAKKPTKRASADKSTTNSGKKRGTRTSAPFKRGS